MPLFVRIAQALGVCVVLFGNIASAKAAGIFVLNGVPVRG
jgi:hypothetical protein